MGKRIFKHRIVTEAGPNNHLLSLQEYPWSVLQIITFDESKYDEVKQKLHDHYQGWVVEYPGRKDFVVLHRGSSQDVPINNVDQVADAIQQAMRDAAECWANNEYVEE